MKIKTVTLTILVFLLASCGKQQTGIVPSEFDKDFLEMKPPINIDNTGKSLGYFMSFKKEGLLVRILIGAIVDGPLMSQEKRMDTFEHKYIIKDQFLRIKFSGNQSKTIDLECSLNDFINLLGIIGSHEIFAYSNDYNQPEPLPLALGKDIIKCIRYFKGQQTIVERNAVVTPPMALFRDRLWEAIQAMMERLPEAEKESLSLYMRSELISRKEHQK
jgi:hypothetical protein